MTADEGERDAASNQLSKHAAGGGGDNAQLTTSNGAPVDSLTASMTVGNSASSGKGRHPSSGHILLQDFTLLDHMARFDRERIPERVVHAKGAGAFGYFEVLDPFLSTICKAKMFDTVGKRTPVAVRFSTVGGESGSPDTARDPRGFAVKFYTQDEGVWDLVGNNTPIFFLRDPILFPSFIHTQKRNPATHLADPDMFWDFISLRPETTHQVSFLFSDRGTPNGYRFMNGYGSHTFKNVNSRGEPCYVKYHFKTDQGVSNLSADEASALASSDPDYATRDLYNAIETGDYPSWTMYLQVMSYDEARQCSFNPFDLTKVWPHSRYPLRLVGRMTLDRNPQDYFTEVEQLAFSPSHMIPGIEPSPDKMLQARLFSYPDTHRHRLGANYQSLPVNSPQQPQQNYQRDGPMQFTSNGGGGPNYFPNSFNGPTPPESSAASVSWHQDTVSGQVQRTDTGDEDNYSQCREFYRSVLGQKERERLTDNIAGHLSRAQPSIRDRAVRNFSRVDPEYGRSIRTKIDRILLASGNGRGKQPKPRAVAPLNPPRSVPSKKAVDGGNRRPACPYGYSSKL